MEDDEIGPYLANMCYLGMIVREASLVEIRLAHLVAALHGDVPEAQRQKIERWQVNQWIDYVEARRDQDADADRMLEALSHHDVSDLFRLRNDIVHGGMRFDNITTGWWSLGRRGGLIIGQSQHLRAYWLKFEALRVDVEGAAFG